MGEYTPTTDEVRDAYANWCSVTRDDEGSWPAGKDPLTQFDLWLAAHDAEVRERCAAIADDVAVRAGSASTHARAAARIAAAIRALGGGSR